VETSVSNCEACKFSGVSIWITAALNCCSDQTKLQELLIEKSCVSTEVTNQVANFGSDIGI
jgi:hypothetical protein